MAAADLAQTSQEDKPGIFIIGSLNVGKRTLLSRLLSVDFDDFDDSSTELFSHGWCVDTKYYTADVSVWMSHLYDGFSISTLPIHRQIRALVMVFNLSELSSLVALKDWVSSTDLHNFDILLCVGNKVDLVPDHPVHAEYRRRLNNPHSSFTDRSPDFSEFGISETEGRSLLGDEEQSLDFRSSCLEWCIQNNIEYVEACASNEDFDKCLSVDGDSQGVERIYGALSAYMWPGMVLKSSNKNIELPVLDKQELSDEESDYEIEYEVLSAGSAEPRDDTQEATDQGISVTAEVNSALEGVQASERRFEDGELQPTTSKSQDEQGLAKEKSQSDDAKLHDFSDAGEPHGDMQAGEVATFDFEDLEQLMSEIGSMRDNLRLMPDVRRKEMAANLALKMAAMFGGGSDEEEEF